MNKMNVFSDTINESFNQTEVVWKGDSYLVDSSSIESVRKLLKLVTGEDDLNKGLVSLALLRDRADFLNIIIKLLPDELLENTKYRKFQERLGEHNWVLYNAEQFTISWGYVAYNYNSTTPEQPINCSSTEMMFATYKGEALDLSDWDVSQISNMTSMFSRCVNLKSLNLNKWNTSKVRNMSYLFSGCEKLEELHISCWDLSNVESTSSMFLNCSSLHFLDVTNWNVGNVNRMGRMFSGCDALKSLDVSKWNVYKVSDMSRMFVNCNSLTSLDLSNWICSDADTSKMFVHCNSLVTTDNQEFDAILNNPLDKFL